MRHAAVSGVALILALLTVATVLPAYAAEPAAEAGSPWETAAEMQTPGAETAQQPVIDGALPAEGILTSTDGEQLPGEEESVPAEAEQLPGEEEAVPGDGEQLTAEEAVPADAEQLPAEEVSEPAVPPFLYVDGAGAAVDHYIADGVTYVSVVDFVRAMDPAGTVTWTGDGIRVETGRLAMSANAKDAYLEANGRYLYLEDGIQLSNGRAMLPLSILAKVFDAQLSWDGATSTAHVTRGSGALESGDTFYDEEAVYLLSHIINAESGNQPLAGKISVGNVIMNRVASSLFPNTISDVIYQKNQFSPTVNGAFQKTPTESSVIAAKLVLDGAVVMDDALFFNTVNCRSWAAKHRTLIDVIGGHAFYR